MTQVATAAPPPKLGFTAQMKSFPATFWVANVIELVERFSFWGIRTIAALYIVTEAERGGLGLTNTDKGLFFGTWSLIQCILPMFTGGFADRYGYRRSLLVAFAINLVGYGLMGFVTSWWGFMGACCLIGVGTAIFKPPLHGTLAHCVNESNSSLGWGVFYQVVNIGAFIGPIVCGYLRLLQWRYAFFTASGIVLINVLITLFILKDYAQGERGRSAGQVLRETMAVFKDFRFVVFLAIFAGFWFMFMQLSDQLAVFIDQWVDRRDVARFLTDTLGLGFLKAEFAKNAGQVNPEWITDIDAGAIIIFVLLISYVARRFRHISVMIVGMFVSCAGLLMAGAVRTGWLSVLAIFIFAVGEMLCSPKFNEYIGLMAPPEKKALYMGYSNIPWAVGWSGANFVGGPLYEFLADKHALARRYLIDVVGQDAATIRGLSKGEVLPRLAQALGQSDAATQQVLWNHFHPPIFFYLVISIGLLATLAMVGYHFWLQADVRRRAAPTVAV